MNHLSPEEQELILDFYFRCGQERIGIEFRTPSKKLQEAMDQVDRDEDMMEFDTVEELFEEL